MSRDKSENYYDASQICLNGHLITERYHNTPEFRKNFCSICGEKTIYQCPNCQKEIKGEYIMTHVVSGMRRSRDTPNICENCGKDFPWSTRGKISIYKTQPLKNKIQMESEIKTETLKLIEDGKIKDSIKKLIEFSKQSFLNEYQNQCVLISSRLSIIEMNYRNGFIDYTEYSIEINKLVSSILLLVDELFYTINNKEVFEIQAEKEEIKVYSNFEDLIGLKVDKYQITEFVDAGGFGAVYKAIHTKLGYIRAIKISHEINKSIEFLNEIMSVGLIGLQFLKHESIVETYDIGDIMINGSNRLYIIMEFIDGGTLLDLKKINLTQQDVLKRIQIYRKVCLGIQYSHNLKFKNKYGFQVTGLMHGDIKPSNILLTNNGEPKIMDFMFSDMSKLSEVKVKPPQIIKELDSMTTMFGTFGYMPKEQEIYGFVTEKTDIFALGILLFELFTTSRFNSCKFNSSNEIHDFLLSQNTKIPIYLSQIIFKATQENENKRYEDVGELIKLLQN